MKSQQLLGVYNVAAVLIRLLGYRNEDQTRIMGLQFWDSCCQSRIMLFEVRFYGIVNAFRVAFPSL